jgi:hypothetical protein
VQSVPLRRAAGTDEKTKPRKECVAVRKWVISTVSAAVLMTAIAMTGCSVLSSPHRPERAQPHTTGAATSKTPAASDYSRLLIKSDAISGLDETYTARPPTLNPHGVPGASVVFVNQANTRAVGNTIFVLPDPVAATAALNGAKQALGTVIEGAVAHPAPVGANGTAAAGSSPDGSKAVTVVMFTEGRTFVTLKFDASTTDAVAPPLATQVAQRQDALIKSTRI